MASSSVRNTIESFLGLTHSHKCRCWRCTVRRFGRGPRRTEREKRQEAAAIFSAVCGTRILTQEEAEREHEKNNRVIREMNIKDVFFNPTEATFWNGKGQEPLFYVSDSAYDSKYDYDFTNLKAEGNIKESCQRGDYTYSRPCGWRRKALKVLGTYEDDIWLGKSGWRHTASPGEWEVSYHGPNIRNIVKDILDRGLNNIDINKDVIYSTPCIKVAERFAVKFSHDEQEYLCILQNRVNLKNIEVISEKDSGVEGPYFVVKNMEDMRPYGLCLKKL